MPRQPRVHIRQRYTSSGTIVRRPHYPPDLPHRRWLFQQTFGYSQCLMEFLKPSLDADGNTQLPVPTDLLSLEIPMEYTDFLEEIAWLARHVDDLQKTLAKQPRCPEVLTTRCKSVVTHCKNINIHPDSPKKVSAGISRCDSHWRFDNDHRLCDVSRFILGILFISEAIDDLEVKRQKAIVPSCQAKHYNLCKGNWEKIIKQKRRMLKTLHHCENVMSCWHWLEANHACQSGPSCQDERVCTSDSYWHCASSEWDEMMKDPISQVDKSVRNLWNFIQYDHGPDY